MKRKIKIFITCFLFILIAAFTYAQKRDGSPAGWTARTFESHVFVENKGQCGKANRGKGKILFSASEQGIDMYWSASGLTYKTKERYLPEEAKKEIREQGDPGEMIEKIRTTYHYMDMEWIGANPDPEIISEEPVSFYYTYADPADKSGRSGIKASAYKKIVYKNLYPGIDAEYILPEKGGLKYSFIVHPGADPGMIKMRYQGADNIILNAAGEIEINSKECGNFLDHRPQSFYQGGAEVFSGFSMQGNIVGFDVPIYDKTKILVIDPWQQPITFPASGTSFMAYSKTGYAVSYDNAGNVWVFGGDDSIQLAKYDNGGNIKWTYHPPIYYAGIMIGDFDVNKVSGSAYLCEGIGWPVGANVVKADANGNQKAVFLGNTKAEEMSRIRLDCSGKLYTTGGGKSNTNPSWQVCTIDTTLTTLTGRHITSSLKGDHDENLMTLDPSGNFMYVNFNYPAPGSSDFLNNNEMQKVPVPAFTPTSWVQPGPIYNFIETNSVAYAGAAPPNAARINIFNGMVCGNNFLYTYDGKTLKQWNKNTGTMIKQVTTTGTIYTTGGIDLDLCENVYVSVGTSIQKYDANLNPLTSYPIPAPYTTCYDLKVDKIWDKIYACGSGYVCAIDLPVTPVPQLTTSVTPAGCNCSGTASASITGMICNNPSTFSYTWLPGGQTTSSISGLCAGTYTVMSRLPVTCGKVLGDTDIVTIAPAGALSTTITSTPASCGAVNGSATVTVVTGTPSYTYSWAPSGGNSSAATGLSTGDYSVTVTDGNGCTTISTVSVSASPGIIPVVSPNSTICSGQSVTLTSSGGTDYVWSNGSTASSINDVPALTTVYSVTVTTGACSGVATVTVTVNAKPVPGFTSKNVCFNNPTLFTDQSTGANQWSWDFGDGNTSTQQSPGHTYASGGSFTVTQVVVNAGCKDSVKKVSLINPLPAANFSSTPVCAGDTTFFTDASAISTGTVTAWSWNFDDPSTAVNNISNLQNPYHVFSGLGPYNVLLTVTSDSGCQNNKTLPVTVNALPAAGFVSPNACLNSISDFKDGSISSSPNDPINNWNWNFGDGSASVIQPNSPHTYSASGTYSVTLIVTSKSGCKDTANNIVTVYKAPVATFSKPDSGCAPLCVGYTDMSTSADGSIDTWQWSFPGAVTTQSGVKDPANICYKAAGNYSVSLVVTSSYGCRDSVALPMIKVFPWPTADFCVAPDVAPATDPVFSFCDMWSSDVIAWAWSFGDNDTDSVSTDPVHSYSATATGNDFYTYSTCIRVENKFGCWDTTCKIVELTPEFEFYIPNTFTPNGDGQNEFFFGKCRGVKEYNIWVFDRWGNLLWDCHRSGKNINWDSPGQDGLSSDCQWNGVVASGGPDMNGHSSKLAQEDVYVWKVQLKDIFDKRHNYVGNVNIVK